MAIHEELTKILLHNSALPTDRSPIGAICEGEAVSLRLRTRDESVVSAEVVLFSDYGSDTVRMQRESDGFRASVGPFSRPGVYFYYFALHHWGDTFYYGAPGDRLSTVGERASTIPAAFQITVYRRDFVTPAWFREGVMYQIFPDRYAKGKQETIRAGVNYHRALGRTIHLHRSTKDPVDYKPRGKQKNYYPNDFYGGTLDAIRRDLPRLKEMGVTCLYLNPVFEADSNHRYNTSDYKKIDPILGTNEDLAALCADAQQHGIRVLFDGVFSHTGADSIYFNREGRYPGPGAYQSENSPYYPWYEFRHFPDDYQCWWGFDSLPEVDEHEPSWQDYIITGEQSVVRTWLRAGVSGYRLDVADELPDDVLEKLRQTAKEEKGDAVILGEVWEDPTTKVSYGVRRSYALGGSLDSVMNYPLRRALLDFALGTQTGFALAELLRAQRLNYPKPLYYSLMNLLSSHDVERVRTVLACGMYADGLSRAQQADFRLSPMQDAAGAKRQAMLAAILYALPGVPCIYYGDEFGMSGFLDPFNRAFLDKNASAHPLTQLYARLGALRRAHKALSAGAVSVFAPQGDALCIVRLIAGGKDVFGQESADECLVLLVNRSRQTQFLAADLLRTGGGFDESSLYALRTADPEKATALLGDTKAEVRDGILTAELPPCTAELFLLS